MTSTATHFAIPASDGQSAILCNPHHADTVVRIERHAAGAEYVVTCQAVTGAFTDGTDFVDKVGVRVTGTPEGWHRQWTGGGYRHAAGTDLTTVLRDAVERVSDVFDSDRRV